MFVCVVFVCVWTLKHEVALLRQQVELCVFACVVFCFVQVRRHADRLDCGVMFVCVCVCVFVCKIRDSDLASTVHKRNSSF